MNTNAVAKLLGVSPSTIQRWVKHANLEMNRNELGHYVFREEDIEVLKNIQEQINNGVLLQDIAAASKKTRQAKVKKEVIEPNYEKLQVKMKKLEQQVDRKADEIVSYQLLQHRREIEDLHEQIRLLTERIEQLEATNEENKATAMELVAASSEEKKLKKFKLKSLFSSIFNL